jgi:DNA integrity scanning protein DisA with diadenylate cyclase activity
MNKEKENEEIRKALDDIIVRNKRGYFMIITEDEEGEIVSQTGSAKIKSYFTILGYLENAKYDTLKKVDVTTLPYE